MKVIILAGGSGSRLWPLSRTRYPKQFLDLTQSGFTLFQETFRRALKLANVKDIYIVTSKDYPYIVEGQINQLGHDISKENIISEPFAMNTLPAIASGMLKFDVSDVCLVMPSDHIILNEDYFIQQVQNSLDLAQSHLITFGIKPNSPKTGYGYIEKANAIKNGFTVNNFKEKPDEKLATEYINQGYLWNAGIFLFKKEVFMNELAVHQEDYYQIFKAHTNIDEIYANLTTKTSIDYGLLEKSKNVAVVPVDLEWNDLGSFDAIDELQTKDVNFNTLADNIISFESKNNLVQSATKKVIALANVNDLIVVDTPDALLVSQKGSSQSVKSIIEKLEEKGDLRKDFHVKDYRPWGHYQVLDELEGVYKVKRIFVQSGKKLSYQMHHHRSEHWIVVRGTATVTIDDKLIDVNQGESTFIKVTQKHRLENKTEEELEIIEVQLGNYLEEDDIIRFDDDFNRISG